jgi:hypothetical protein
VLLVNLEESDLAFRTAFPIMVTNALNWFANQSGRLNPALETGSLVAVELPSADELPQVAASGEVAGDLRLQSPQGQSVVLSPAEGASDLSVGPLDRVGVWELSRARAAGGEDSPEELVKRFAVNISSERETDLQASPEFLDRSDSRLWGGRWFTRPIWFYLAMLAALFTGIEWFLYHRRFIS